MAPEEAEVQSGGAGSQSQPLPTPSAPQSSPDVPPGPAQAPPRKGDKRLLITCLVIGCLAALLVVLVIGGCVGFGAWGTWQVGKAVKEEIDTEARLAQAHELLAASAAANGGVYPAEFDCAGQLGAGADAGAGGYVYVPGLRQDMPKGFILVYRKYVIMGSATAAAVTIGGTVMTLTPAELDELLAAQQKALDALKEGGEKAEGAVKEFETIYNRQEAERKARESQGSGDIDWD